MNAIDDGPITVIPTPAGSERIPNLIPEGDLTAAILAAVDEDTKDEDEGGARDECPNHHAATNGVCRVGWCPYSS